MLQFSSGVRGIALGALVAIGCIGLQLQVSAQPDEGAAHQEASDDSTSDQREDDMEDVEPLAEYAWTNRPVLVFASSPDEPTYRDQHQRFEDAQDGLHDREIVLYRVFDEGESLGPEGPISSAEARQLRERFGPDGAFTVVLVGKDTTEKLRQRDVLSTQELFETIDAMPMRQREMRESDE